MNQVAHAPQGHPSVIGPARELADQARIVHVNSLPQKDCGIEGANPNQRFGRWVSTNFAETQSSTILNARRLWEVFSDRREYALAESHPEFPDKSPVEINRPFISMADSAPACFISGCRDIHMSTNGHQCFCGVKMINQLPETGFFREKHFLSSPDENIPPLIPISKSTWRRGCKSGRFPPPIKNGRISVWPVETIRALIANGLVWEK